MKIHNFSAGPSILPRAVIEKSAQAVLNYQEKGLSILEMSHRDAEFVEVMERSESLVAELLHLPASYKVLFLSGGASLGFHITALNLLKEKAAYVNTGTWATNAIEEAKKVGQVDVVASSEDKKFNYIPKNYNHQGYDYIHITSNNTIYGTQYQDFIKYKSPAVCDMSSDIFSRVFDPTLFQLIYAGAQKNMGPAGTTLYIVDQQILGKTGRILPSMLDLQVHIKNKSMFNTPPVFPILVSMYNLEWLKEQGGVVAAEQRNLAKAKLLYNEIDRNGLFYGFVEREDRSNMNVTFSSKEEPIQKLFLQACEQAGINGIKGHRSVGGFRASLYNALPIESVQVLVDVMQHIEQKHG